jgi:hypothetical protein
VAFAALNDFVEIASNLALSPILDTNSNSENNYVKGEGETSVEASKLPVDASSSAASDLSLDVLPDVPSDTFDNLLPNSFLDLIKVLFSLRKLPEAIAKTRELYHKNMKSEIRKVEEGKGERGEERGEEEGSVLQALSV